ncbi:hypothetical protein B4U79_18588 [Dinothrombium tinctorium]|uniref:Peptidase M16 N-terminal domain-containing protein n=1 Tax=Dinothrombium tinctorium TaxID=1965070 RepID=A0A3S3PHN0_9ACAR|nr:hypothetical protein B4U79_18588 [Dinothrombium tinctorium]
MKNNCIMKQTFMEMNLIELKIDKYSELVNKENLKFISRQKTKVGLQKATSQRIIYPFLSRRKCTKYEFIAEIHRDIIKQPHDNRSFEAYTLINGLKLLLISKSKTGKAAAALNVNIGSFNDPESFQGLAHLLEHLLFKL